jgi:hypothetical protein
VPDMNKIFLSHPHAEGEIAVSFARWLEKVFRRHTEVICTSEPEYRISGSIMVTRKIVEHVKSSSVVICLISPRSLILPWLFYEMGAAQALGKIFIPCVMGGLSLRDLPPQAFEYQGVELSSEEGLRSLVRNLSDYLNSPVIILEGVQSVTQSFG